MLLKQRIYQNIVEQIAIGIRAEQAREKMRQLERENNVCAGKMSVLADLWFEETGVDIQQAINTHPEWSDLVKKAEEEAKKIVADSGVVGPPIGEQASQQPAQDESAQEQPTRVVPTMKRVANNRHVAQSRVEIDDTPAQEVKPQQRSNLNDRGQPIKFTVDDNPPAPPPGTQATHFDDE